MRRSIPIEDVLDITDPDLWFYYIHEFPAYEISSPISHNIYDKDGSILFKAGSSVIRSLKSVYKYPYGVLIKPIKRSNENDPSFMITNNNNERINVRLSQLVYMALNLPYAVSGYPRHANMVSTNCRNDRIFINKKLKYPELDNTTKFYPKFRIVEDENSILKQNHNMCPIPDNIVVPIESIDGSEYYGRRDIKIEYGRTNY